VVGTGGGVKGLANNRWWLVKKWTPQGQRSRGRPRGTRKRTYETERKGANRTGLEIERMAQDRIEWRQFVSALCASGPTRID
jgi:hypothetical protein